MKSAISSSENRKITVPKVVVFDLGKVLLEFDYSVAARRLQAHCRLSADEIRKLIDQSSLLYRYETNLLTTEQFFAEVQTGTGFGGDLSSFRHLFSDIFTPIEPMVALHAELRQRGIPTYIFSNTNFLAVEHIRERYPFFQNFNDYILSCEHGAMKPDHKLYEVVETRTGQSGSAILYIDDRLENIAAGLERGWNAILHQSPEATIDQVCKTGILVS